MTVGEAAIVVAGVIGLGVNMALLREARGVRQWVRDAGGTRAARLARNHVWRANLRIVASLGALIVGGLASATPGRFDGQGIGLGIAIVAGVSSFAAIVTASILDMRNRSAARHGVVRELLAELDGSRRLSGAPRTTRGTRRERLNRRDTRGTDFP